MSTMSIMFLVGCALIAIACKISKPKPMFSRKMVFWEYVLYSGLILAFIPGFPLFAGLPKSKYGSPSRVC